MSTIRQKIAFIKTMENHGNVSKAMREAGYSKSHAKNPQYLIRSKGFQEMLNEYVSEKVIAHKVEQLLNTAKLSSKHFNIQYGVDDVKTIFKKAKIEVVDIRVIDSEIPYIEVLYKEVDAIAQDRALEKAIKLHGLYESNQNKQETKGFSLIDLFNSSTKNINASGQLQS